MNYMSVRAAIYIRQSKEKNDSISPDVQREACGELARREGWTVVREFTDIGQSSYTKHWTKRREFPALVSAVEAGEIDKVIVYRWSRLSRKATDALVLWDLLESKGAKVEAAAERMDTATAAGRLGARNMLMFAAFESELRSEQFKEAHTRRVSKGLPRDGHARFGYDYVGAQYVINEEQAETIRMAFRWYMSGNSMLAIADMLNEAGRRTAAGKPFSHNSIFRVLDYGFPFGVLRLDEGQRWETGSHEPILSADDWAAYKAERERRSTGKRERINRDMHELAGIGRCGPCGAPLVFRHRERGYLVCSTNNQARGRCEGVNVKEHELWHAFQAALGDATSDAHELLHEAIHEATAGLDDEYAAAKRDRDAIKRDVTAAEDELGKLASGWASGILDDAGYRAAAEAARTRLSEASSRLVDAEAVVLAKRPPEGVERLHALNDMTNAETNALYRRAVREIRFYDDRMVCVPAKGDEFTLQRETPRQKYPLDEWLDGGVHVLVPGQDFTTPIKSMRQTLRGAAKRRGMTISCRTTDDGHLEVRPTA